MPEDRAPVRRELEPIDLPGPEQALVSFITGEVFLLKSEDWLPVNVGDLVSGSDTIRTGGDSFCELQFNGIATVRVQAGTVLYLESISLERGKNAVQLRNAVGSLLCKVSELSGNDRFRIHTDLAVVGVRGTEFLVRRDRSENTIVAVREGALAILPAPEAVVSLEERLAGRETELAALLDKLEDSALVVGGNREIRLGPEQSYRDTVSEINEIVDRLLDAAVSPADIEKALTRIETVIGPAIDDLGPPVTLAEENRKELELIDQLRPVEISTIPASTPTVIGEPSGAGTGGDGGAGAGGVAAARTAGPVRIVVAAEPDDSIIALNGIVTGKGRVGLLAEKGEDLSFMFIRPGYRPRVLDLKDVSSDAVYTVKLLPLVNTDQMERLSDAIGGTGGRTAAPPGRPSAEESAAQMEERLRREITTDLEAELSARISARIEDRIRRELDRAPGRRQATEAERIIGVWETILNGTLAYMEFSEDGSFRTWIEDRSDPASVGTYAVEGSRLVMKSPDGTESGSGTVEFPLDWKLVITRDEEEPAYLYRSQ